MSLKKLFPYIGQFKKQSRLAPLFVALEVVFDILIPFMMSKIVDVGIASQDVSYIIRMCLLMVGAALLALVCGTLGTRFATLSATGFAMNLRRALFSKIQDFSFYNIDKFSTASLTTRLTTDIQFIQIMYQMLLRMFIRAPLMMICATFMALTINKELAVVFLVAIPVLAFFFAFITLKAHPRFVKMLAKVDSLNKSVQENLIAIRVVKAFVQRDYENAKFESAALDLQNAQRQAEKIVILNNPIMTLTMDACIIAILWFGGNKIIIGEMMPGALFSFLTYTTQIITALMLVSMVFTMFVISQASADRIVEVLEEKIDLTDDTGNPDLRVKEGEIEFQDVNFSYAKSPDNLTLCDINLHIKPGEMIGIIGGTGSAKTTLVQLIPRLYDVLSGQVLVSGHDVREYKLNHLRDAVAMVLQKNVLFSGTIADNLRWGNENATDEELVRVCKVAQAHDFIMSFPDGYQTVLGQGGVNVSGGQKQRLCIARALLKNPKIIILDDSTSAIDTATELRFRKAFRENYRETTILMIAQRIQSIKDSDRILVMNEGKIDAFGTHDELIETNTIYREVFESQQKGVAL
ncbi:MAG TPA: ABC transporter ATP-binding protein [Flexilinea sp.]|nr:ABC transporter ATP-binding protein [Flexilinea sp.]HPJ64405.1 ABC transporter ATP-binding protein [Flexilinea sp.]HPR71382.1 ABC transporter ATP-binding protein [Flexilinea sp.]